MTVRNLVLFAIGLFLLLATMVALIGFAPSVPLAETVDPSQLYGFWSGVWHGFIFVISFIGSLLSDDIAVYATNNTGGGYDFGFLVGLAMARTTVRAR